MSRMTRAVTGLLVVNIAVFAAGYLLPEAGPKLITAAALWYPTHGNFELWQTVTYMFLHGGTGHLFFNMFGLVSFGMILEDEWGAARFLLFYFLCGIGAALVQMGVNWYEFHGLHERLVAAGVTPADIKVLLAYRGAGMPANPAARAMFVELLQLYSSPMLGASGAVYGVMVAFGLLHPNAKLMIIFVPVPVAAKIVIPILLLLDLFAGVTGFSLFGASVAHFAHLGGALIGFLLMLLWRDRSRGPDGIGPRREGGTFR